MNIEEKLKEMAEQLIKLIGVEGKVEVSQTDETFNVQIDGDDVSVLIGYRGEVLESIQHILSLMVRDGEESHHVIVEIGDYRKTRNTALEDLAKTTADKVRFTGKPIELSPMSSYERRVLHLIISEQEGVESSSVDEGEYRRVVISPKGYNIEEN